VLALKRGYICCDRTRESWGGGVLPYSVVPGGGSGKGGYGICAELGGSTAWARKRASRIITRGGGGGDQATKRDKV